MALENRLGWLSLPSALLTQPAEGAAAAAEVQGSVPFHNHTQVGQHDGWTDGRMEGLTHVDHHGVPGCCPPPPRLMPPAPTPRAPPPPATHTTHRGIVAHKGDAVPWVDGAGTEPALLQTHCISEAGQGGGVGGTG